MSTVETQVADLHQKTGELIGTLKAHIEVTKEHTAKIDQLLAVHDGRITAAQSSADQAHGRLDRRRDNIKLVVYTVVVTIVLLGSAAGPVAYDFVSSLLQAAKVINGMP